jgi:hypothetical protein
MAKKMGKMSGDNMCMSCCDGCGTWVALVVLVAGVLWLLNDYGMASFWNVSWWTLGALLLGITWMMKKC